MMYVREKADYMSCTLTLYHVWVKLSTAGL